MLKTRTLIVVFVSFAAIRCTDERVTAAPPDQAAPKTAPSEIKMEEIAVPAGAGAAEPFLSSAGDGVLLSWLEPVAGTDKVALRVARYRGRQWTDPRTVLERNDLFVNWADFPSVIEDASGALFAHWLQKSGSGTYAYDVRMSVSRDDGGTWSKPFLLNRDGTKTEHGFASLAALPKGGVGATWLDGRKMKPGEHEHDAGNMTIRYATVAPNGTLSNDVQLDERTCECCATGMAVTSAGPVVVYRDRSADEIRDIYYVRGSASGWTKPRPIRSDGWKIDGCPVNGPQIDAIGTHVAASWFTAAQDVQRVYAAFSADGGATFEKPVVVDDGKPAGRVDIVLLDEKTALVTWLEQTPGGAEIRARRVPRKGKPEASMKIADSSIARAAGFPRIARVGREVWFAWTEQSATSKRIHVGRGAFQ